MKKYGAEFFGTFWLVLGGCGSAVLAAAFPQVGIGLLGVSLAFGLTVVTMAYAIGHISGCHLNPAVSVGLCIGGRFPASQLLPYIVAQVLGAVCALALAGWLLNAPTESHIRSKLRPSYDGHDLPQPELRHVPNHPRDDPPERNSASQIPNGARTS